MVYKLSDYSYSFIQRLRELASPLEAYNLQVADIDGTLSLKPLQELTEIQFEDQMTCYFFHFSNAKVFYSPLFDEEEWLEWNDHKIEIALTQNVLHTVRTLVIQSYVTFEPFGSTVFKHFALDLQNVTFKSSSIDKEVFTALQPYIRCTNFEFVDCEIDSNLTIKDILYPCDAKSKSLYISGIWKHQWLPKLLDSLADLPSMVTFNYVSLLEVTSEEISDFFYKVSRIKKSFELRICDDSGKDVFEFTKLYFTQIQRKEIRNSSYRLILHQTPNDYYFKFNKPKRMKRQMKNFNNTNDATEQ
uniref:FTH domain-containing protein n=1 Tax=Panagrellus redivivus TaxID=6233 RepID=A0A7E4W548_PANRE